MKLSEFKANLDEVVRDLFIQQKASLPMGSCPDDIEIFVRLADCELVEPLIEADVIGKIIL